MLYLRADFTRIEPDLESAALTSSTSLGAASARGDSDIAITGAPLCETEFLTSKAKELRIPIHNAKWNEESKTFGISDRTQILVTCSRLASAVNGVLCESVSGQAAVSLQHYVGSHPPSSVVPVEYTNWSAISSVIGISNASIVDDEDEPVRVSFTTDSSLDSERQKTHDIMKNLYKASWETRETHVYDPAPNLTKSFMKVPFGVDGTQFDFSSSAVGKAFPLSADSFEALLKATVGLEFAFDEDVTKNFLDPEVKGVAASRWAGNVVSSFSTMAAFLMAYRADGTTAVLPDKLQDFATESWLAEPLRIPFPGDDCEGSAALISSGVHFLNVLFSNDASAKTRYPYLYAAHRSLVHHEVGIAVIGANAAHAGDADTNAKSIAGHAVCVFVPKMHILKALAAAATGAEHTLTRLEAMYPSNSNLPITFDESKVLSSGWQTASTSELFSGLTALAAEGTAPADSRLWTPDVQERMTRSAQADAEKLVADSLSPSVALVVKTLDASQNGRHRFYSDFVELVLATSSPLLTTPALQRAGVATSHLVFTDAASGKAGIGPQGLAEGSYQAVPLWSMGASDAPIVLDALREVQTNTMARRKGPVTLNDYQAASLRDSLKAVDEIEVALANGTTKPNTSIVATVSYSALVHNPSSLELLRDLIRNSGASGVVDRVSIPGLAKYATGEEAGVFLAFNLSFPR
ncbi:MAG: hypothetical protein CMJ93_04475 [Planctomycetes bacterium]|nr:hypothetical protein [Planctomycetota bacterium]